MDCDSDGGVDGERTRLLSKPRTLESRVRTPCGAGIVCLPGVLNVDMRSIQGTRINFHLCALTVAI